MKWIKITSLLLLIGLLAGCGKKAPAPTEPNAELVTTVSSTTEQTEDIPNLTEQAKLDGVAVETPYITLYYPKQWTELQSATVTREGENSRLTFCVAVGDQTVELFSVIIGPEDTEGYLLGTLDGMYVYSVMNEQNPEAWSEEDYMNLCRQQEYINELILQLYENSAFTPS